MIIRGSTQSGLPFVILKNFDKCQKVGDIDCVNKNKKE